MGQSENDNDTEDEDGEGDNDDNDNNADSDKDCYRKHFVVLSKRTCCFVYNIFSYLYFREFVKP